MGSSYLRLADLSSRSNMLIPLFLSIGWGFRLLLLFVWWWVFWRKNAFNEHFWSMVILDFAKKLHYTCKVLISRLTALSWSWHESSLMFLKEQQPLLVKNHFQQKLNVVIPLDNGFDVACSVDSRKLLVCKTQDKISAARSVSLGQEMPRQKEAELLVEV